MSPKSSTRRRHTAAFKWEAVQVMQRRLGAGDTLRRVSEELDISVGMLRCWAQAVAGAPAGASVDEIFPGSGHVRTFPAGAVSRPALPTESPEAELGRLRRENERLRMERDFLKKAAAFFAKESR
jgi:transposase